MKLEVDFNRNFFLAFIFGALIVGGIVGVVAYNSDLQGGDPAVFGHSIDEIRECKSHSSNSWADPDQERVETVSIPETCKDNNGCKLILDLTTLDGGDNEVRWVQLADFYAIADDGNPSSREYWVSHTALGNNPGGTWDSKFLWGIHGDGDQPTTRWQTVIGYSTDNTGVYVGIGDDCDGSQYTQCDPDPLETNGDTYWTFWSTAASRLKAYDLIVCN